MAINSSHLNLSGLAEATEESLVVRVVQNPRIGWLKFRGRNVSDDSVQFTEEDLGDHLLVYHHSPDAGVVLTHEDHILLEVFPNSESYGKKRRNMRLRFNLPVRVLSANHRQLKV